MSNFKKVLICCPTADVKNYCFREWIKNVMNFSYPNFQIRLFDNSSDKGANAVRLNKYVEEHYGDVGIDKKFYCQNSLIINASKEVDNLPKMTMSHNDCRTYAMKHGYEYILHLESDVFPQTNIIETLMVHKKQVVGAVYYRGFGINRSAMLQKFVSLAYNSGKTLNFTADEDVYFLDGSLKQTAHAGLGCVLIHTNVFKKIKFRYVKDKMMHPDSYFAEDTNLHKIKIFADTSCIASHDNEGWGIYGIDWK